MNSGVSGPNVTKIVHSVEKFIVVFEIGIAILQSVSEWQRDKVDWSAKNADFSTSIGCHGNVPWKIKKAQWSYQALSPVYQSWNFGEDQSSGFWASGAPEATTKKIKNKELENAWHSLAYSPLGASVSPPSITKPCYHLANVQRMHVVSVCLYYGKIIWLPWQCPLTNWKIRYKSIICT